MHHDVLVCPCASWTLVKCTVPAVALRILRKAVQFLATRAANCETAAFVFGVFSSSASGRPADLNRVRNEPDSRVECPRVKENVVF